MTTYVLTGTFAPDRALTEPAALEICTYFATFLRSKHYKAYEVWAGYRATDKAWRFLVALRGPVRQMPELTVLNEVQDLFDAYVVKETCQTRWVDALEDPYCWDVEGWVDWGRRGKRDKETLEEKEGSSGKGKGDGGSGSIDPLIMLSCDAALGEVF
ncbi:hypothetical protein BJY00DRAFT_311054 [Aspergillus carlsbadensis]|nr:hypothetical protein BJY00DRAFT_311054 [Aspergillus carlsbadensis]